MLWVGFTPATVAAGEHRGARGAANQRCPSGDAHLMPYTSTPLEIVPGNVPACREVGRGKKSRQKLPAGLCWFSGAAVLARAWQTPQSQACRALVQFFCCLLPDGDCLPSGTGWLNHLEILPPMFLLALFSPQFKIFGGKLLCPACFDPRWRYWET